jgi:hypothetical protein
MSTIDEKDMPGPDTIVLCKTGGPIAVMFYYAAAEQDLSEIAIEQGFDIKIVVLDEENGEDHMERWFEGDEKVLEEWQPVAPEGWTLAAKFDNEDGPMAIFIKPSEELIAQREKSEGKR